MQAKHVWRKLSLTSLIITLLGLWGGWYLTTQSEPATMELPNAYLNANLVSLYLQPAVLILIYNQILTFRKINLLVGVRQWTNKMIARLLILATLDCLLFCAGLIIPYLMTDFPFFRNGSPLLGTALLLLHVAVLILMAWLLVGAYQMRYPQLLLFIVIIIDLVYHFYFEKQALILYSPLYDPLYRAVHRIYGGY
ncbi:hypothetical protein OZX56_02760 [Lactobacillus sp. ESL0684]|uniref:hypothetical protein n=1 Tax=Lactobacillus sp. ESL0684 TaxID=2983213 RepID=UPI0023F8C1F1|nr:hypothetical protein [Lactobacillus sp. ESL0684]WEV44167.1 hypothetical protein OZX56_02760 [Lactobacillus sp. ESL0684]